MSTALKCTLKPIGEGESLAWGWNIKGSSRKQDHTAICIITVNIFFVRTDDNLFIKSKVEALENIVG